MFCLPRILFLVVILVGILLDQVSANDFWRLRYLVLSEEQGTVTHGDKKSEETLHTEGYSVHLVFSNGLGFGCTTMKTSSNFDSDSYTNQSDNIDISYTLGSNWSLTLGYGRGMAGYAEINGNTDYESNKVLGDSAFILFGIPFIGGELIGGIRKNQLEFGPYNTRINGTDKNLEKNVYINSEHIMLGYGIHF